MSYEVDGHEYDFDSVVNQRIKGQFVSREVLACISDFSDHLFAWDDGDKYAIYDEFENYYAKVCPECGDTYGFEEDESEDGEAVWRCRSCGHVILEDVYNNLDEKENEICEWWIVTPWFGQKLKDAGEVTLERMMGWIWGRCGSGQAISLDNVISDICCGMCILEGQSYDWSKQGG